ncbi:peroxide stress protein YaaA [Gorillibacterium sp. sgz5001074]|uniref:peroxide stress protein YaaA n=1 Tax=Gorillibacterium sp. sgz5001074 TaxID=3446695 RepID=UPI003F670F12
MRIILSPAKKMKTDTEIFECRQLPAFIGDAEKLLDLFRQLSYEEAKAIWNCNDAIAVLNFDRFRTMDLYRSLTPAVFAYEGIQYQYMAPGVFQTKELEYLQDHVRILSGFYGLLRPMDGVVPYRLEMQAKWSGPGFRSLYAYWGRRLADQLFRETRVILNLASKEYSKCISPYVEGDVRFVTCVFGQLIDGKVVEKSTFAKMARGEMVRYMAENGVQSVEEVKAFNRMNFEYAEERSDGSTYVFLQRTQQPTGLEMNDE